MSERSSKSTIPVPKAPISKPIPLPKSQPIIPQPIIPQPVIPQPVTPQLKQPIIKPIIRQPTLPFQPTPKPTSKPKPTPKSVIAPRATPSTTKESPRSIPPLDKEKDIIRNLWVTGTEEQISQIITLTYPNGAPIITSNRRDILQEIISMLLKESFDDVIKFLSLAPDPDYILWEQKALTEAQADLVREIAIQQAEEVGIKGVGKCKYCSSNELVFAQKQTRSGDEPMTIFIRCVNCGKQWRQ